MTQDDVQKWINVQNNDGDTPLHIAAKLGRLDVLEVLFKSPVFDETTRNFSGKTAEESSKNEKISAFFRVQKTRFNQKITTDLTFAIASHSVNDIISFFNGPSRANSYLNIGWFDINGPVDDNTENSLLHYAAIWESDPLMTWCLKNGADPNVRNKKGKKPIDVPSIH
jgi:ankyrin repeat protein